VRYRALRRGDITLTDAQIDTLLKHDAQRAIDTARRQVTGFDSLPLDAQLIVIDMTFNTGSLHKWRRFRAALDRQDYTAAADSMHRSLWRRQTGRRAEHLIELMRSVDDR
jgi:GH24 family phage-related lysozyme (muramidase)